MVFRLGKKLSDGLAEGTRIGKKVLGETSRIGNKISSEGGKTMSMIERIPVIGQALAPATAVGRTAIGLVQNVADLAGAGEAMLSAGEGVVRAGAQAVQTGDVVSAMDALRRGKNLQTDAQSQLERSRKVIADTKAVGRDGRSAFAQTRGNLKTGLAGAIAGGLSDNLM
tara:strand:- start:649 stop:1155 length:507 start_codon:yes stop_codon:yes gene_type:complete